MDFMFAHGGCFMNIMYGLNMIGRFIYAMIMFYELCVRFMCCRNPTLGEVGG